jgi:hypothetical protein
MSSIKDLLQALTEYDVEIHAFRTGHGDARLFFFKRTGDIVTKVGHEFSRWDLAEMANGDAVVGEIMNACIQEVVANHKTVLNNL